jgi:hypothetical protein
VVFSKQMSTPRYGLSLSLCVLDIAQGKVKYDDVQYIVCSCGLMALVVYPESYWKKEPQALEIAKKLQAEGKLQFPVNDDPPKIPDRPMNDPYWVDSPDKIKLTLIDENLPPDSLL